MNKLTEVLVTILLTGLLMVLAFALLALVSSLRGDDLSVAELGNRMYHSVIIFLLYDKVREIIGKLK